MAPARRPRGSLSIAQETKLVHEQIALRAQQLNGGRAPTGRPTCPTREHSTTIRGSNIWLKNDENFGKYYTFCKNDRGRVCHFEFIDRQVTGHDLAHDPVMSEHLASKERLDDPDRRHILPTALAASVVRSRNPTRSRGTNLSRRTIRSSPPRFSPPLSSPPLSSRTTMPFPMSSPTQSTRLSTPEFDRAVLSSPPRVGEDLPYVSARPAASGLHLTKAINALIYQSATSFCTCQLSLRKSGNILVLSDHKLVLGSFGLEIVDSIQRLTSDQIWEDVRWWEPVTVAADGIILLKPKGMHVVL
ncbi:hypothetical protein VKT23_003405 [Stygiomarasmius scandens]|uniref:Uncharacterized protein n=1 Tax=Marasmiellus scandens TaxID=2682957 RepID=A0ABR1JYT4_9AGAR